jgi:hypothetical protein
VAARIDTVGGAGGSRYLWKPMTPRGRTVLREKPRAGGHAPVIDPDRLACLHAPWAFSHGYWGVPERTLPALRNVGATPATGFGAGFLLLVSNAVRAATPGLGAP